MSNLKSDVASWTRWVHIYLSLFSFATLLFFAVTGITLNHTSWIEGQQKVEQLKGKLPLDWVHLDSTYVKELKVVEYLRNNYSIKAPLSDFITEATECAVSFKGPGYSADVFVDRETGQFQLTVTQSGFIAILNDLHKGRDTGATWSWVIDISAALMILVSLSGFAMIFFLKKKRIKGVVVTTLGAFLLLAIYYFCI